MILLSIILQISGYYHDVYQTSDNSWLAIVGSVLGGIVSGGSLIYFVFFRQFKLKHQSEAEKLKHEADQEEANAELHETKVRQEIRRIANEELERLHKQASVLRNEIVVAQDKAYRSRIEVIGYKKLTAKLEVELTQIKELLKELQAGFCSNMICPNRINSIDETKN